MNDTPLNIKIPSELYEKIKEKAKSKNISIASLVRMVLTEYLEK